MQPCIECHRGVRDCKLYRVFSFVQAVEKLHMNQVVSEQCVEILQSAVMSLQEAGEPRTHHALLLVNSKLLSLYSK